MDSRPILVTGAHRSGTTWVGKMLAAGQDVAYISEPLNVLHRRGVLRAPTQYWYAYITDENQNVYIEAFKEMLQFRYHTWLEVKSLRSVKDFFRMVRDWWTFWYGRQNHQRPLIKDPFAVFSTDWLVRRLEFQPVIVVRHPAAVVSSLSRLGWSFDFFDLLNQPLLMRDWLEPFKEDINATVESGQDVIAQGSLLWKMLYSVVADMKDRHPDFLIIRHEDLSNDPVNQFEQLYDQVGLKFSPQSKVAIESSSSEGNPTEISKRNVHSVEIDSQANIKNWQKRLTKGEIERIYQLTREIAPNYYSEADWQ
jgi:hypothetical protein